MRWLIILTILVSFPVYGQKQCPRQIYTDLSVEPDCNCPGPGEEDLLPKLELKETVALEPNQPAPWAGLLMDKNRVLRLGLRVKALRRLRWEELRYCGELAAAELDYLEDTSQAEINLRTSQRDTYKAQVDVLQKEVARLSGWYRSPILWFSVGVVVTAAATATAVVVAK